MEKGAIMNRMSIFCYVYHVEVLVAQCGSLLSIDFLI